MSADEIRRDVRLALKASCETCLPDPTACHISAILTLSPNGNALAAIDDPQLDHDEVACVRQQLTTVLMSSSFTTSQVLAAYRSQPVEDCLDRRCAAAARCHPADLMCQMRAHEAPLDDAEQLSPWHQSETCDFAFVTSDHRATSAVQQEAAD